MCEEGCGSLDVGGVIEYVTVVGNCTIIKVENSMMGKIKHNTTIRRNVMNEDVEEGSWMRGFYWGTRSKWHL